MPYMPPWYFAPPMEYRDNWSQHITFRSDPKVISKLIPKPPVPDPNGTMFMLTSYFFATGFGHYREATLCAHAKFKGKPVNFALKELIDPSELGGTTEYVNWKLIPSVKNGAPPDVNQLT